MDPQLIETLQQFADAMPPRTEPRIVVDGGFHRGGFSLAVCRALQQVRCVGFEPHGALLEAALAKLPNDLPIEAHAQALAEGPGRAILHTSEKRPATNSLLQRPAASADRPFHPRDAIFERGVEVETVSLDDVAEERGITSVFLLKLDLQGGELAALRGAQRLLAAGKVDLVLSEAVFVEKYRDQPLLHELWAHLAGHGFRLYAMYDLKRGDYDAEPSPLREGQYNQCDCLFVAPHLARLCDRGVVG